MPTVIYHLHFSRIVNTTPLENIANNANVVFMATPKMVPLVNHVLVHVFRLQTGLICSRCCCRTSIFGSLGFSITALFMFPSIHSSAETEATCSMNEEGEPVCDRCPEGHEGNLCNR